MGQYVAYKTKRDGGKPRRYRTERTCSGKRYFADEIGARAVGAVTVEGSYGEKSLWVYRCKHCPGWHLTSKNQGARWLVAAKNTQSKHAA